MNRRESLRAKLKSILGEETKLYYQPPESIKLLYPCLVYRLANGDIKYGNNKTYAFERSYILTYITKDPDHEFIEKLLEGFSKISYDRRLVYDNLYQDTFLLYY